MAGMKLPAEQHITSVTVTSVTSDTHVVLATNEGIKTTSLTDYPSKGRGTQGVRAYKFRANEPHAITGSTVTDKPVNASNKGKPVALPKQYAGKRDGTGIPHGLGEFTLGTG